MAKIVVLTAMGVEIPQCLRGKKPGTWQQIGGNSVCVVVSGMGPVRARKVAQAICTDLNPDLLVVLGVCGGAAPNLKVGEVVVATGVAGNGHTILFPSHHLPLEEGLPRMVRGLIQSFERPVTSKAEVLVPGIIAVDMEVYAVVQVATNSSIPIRIFKVVSDTLPFKRQSFQPWAQIRLVLRICWNWRKVMRNLNQFTVAYFQGLAENSHL